MLLLVSIRDPDEIEAALAGGADIIDAKEPGRGALGPVAPDLLRAIDDRVPDDVPLSLALGDATSEVAAGIAILPVRRRSAPVYLKLGLPTAADGSVKRLLTAAVEAAESHPASPRLIAVEYADSPPGGLSSSDIVEAAAEAGAAGLLVDTITKDGRTLFAWWTKARLAAWVESVRGGGLSVAVAGSLGVAELSQLAGLGPDIVGVRGAACLGGRTGAVQADRVRLLRTALAGDSRPIANRQGLGTGWVVRSILK